MSEHRSFPEAANGLPQLTMEAELWAAGCDLETARFVARQLANKGYILAKWEPIATCPYRTSVDLWCVYGDELYAKWGTGQFAPVGKMVPNRFRHPHYEWFGNQSPQGIPCVDQPDMKPVAWRPAAPLCPPEIIAAALGVPIEPPQEGDE